MKKYTPHTPKPPASAPAYTRASRLTKRRILDARFLALAASLACLPTAQGVILTPPAGTDFGEHHGGSLSISGTTAIVGYSMYETSIGNAYIYTNLDSTNPTQIRLPRPQEIQAYENTWDSPSFGTAVGISGDIAIVGAPTFDSERGAAYIYSQLSSGTPTITKLPYPQTIRDAEKVYAYGNTYATRFGSFVRISGDIAIVAAYGNNAHSVYLYTGLNSGEIAAPIVLGYMGTFGYSNNSMDMSEDIVVIAQSTGVSFYKNLTSATPTSTSLPKPSGASSQEFGFSASISGDIAIIGSPGKYGYYGGFMSTLTGDVYYYTGLSSGTITQSTFPRPSSLETNSGFGSAVSISGDRAIVGASSDASGNGAVFLYKNLLLNSPTVAVKILASDGAMYAVIGTEGFGKYVCLSEDLFLLGATQNSYGTGKVYAGDIRAFTTLNADSGATLSTAGLSFVSQEDWVIGDSTINNKVTLSKVQSTKYNTGSTLIWFSDTANVTVADTAVYIGKKANASNNMLVIEGELTANKIYIGASTGANDNILVVSANSTKTGAGAGSGKITITAAGEIRIGVEGNSGNTLLLENPTTDAAGINTVLASGATVYLSPLGKLLIKGVAAVNGTEAEPIAPFDVVKILDEAGVALTIMDPTKNDGSYQTLTADNANQFIETKAVLLNDGDLGSDGGRFTQVFAQVSSIFYPEPSTYALFGGVLLAGLVFIHRRRKRAKPTQE